MQDDFAIMADVLSEEQRRRAMRNIHGKDTRPELVLRKALWHKGYRYRKNYRLLPGTPDIVLTRQRICIFVDSEFFHGKGFESCYRSTKYRSLREQLEKGSHSDFWLKKIRRNIKRDREAEVELRGMGWSVLRFWSLDVMRHTDECIRTIEEQILSDIIENG